MQTVKNTEPKSVVTISVCFPMRYAKLLDAYRVSQTYKVARSNVIATVMSDFLEKQLREMPWLETVDTEGHAKFVAPVSEAKESLLTSTERALSLIASTAKE